MVSSNETFRITTSTRQIARFLTVGVLGTGIDVALFVVLYSFFGLSVIVANVIAYSFGIVHNYFLHRYWTYGNTAHKAAKVQALQFIAVSLCALTVNTTLVVVLSAPLAVLFGGSSYSDLLAKLCATCAGVGINFLVNHLWTFRDTSVKGDLS